MKTITGSLMSHSLLKQADLLLQQKQYAMSIDCYQKFLNQIPDCAEAMNNLGLAYKGLGKMRDAEASFKKALQIRPRYAAAFNNLGNLFVLQNRLAEAEACFRKALDCNPEFAEACNNLGNVLASKTSFDDAWTYYFRAIRIRPDYAEAYNNLGNLCHQQEHWDQAQDYYSRALQLDPGHYKALNNMGSTLQRKGMISEAIRCFNQALSIQPDFAETHANLANALVEAGQIESALHHYLKAIRMVPDNSAFNSNLLLAMQYSTDIGLSEMFVSATRFWNRRTQSMMKRNLHFEQPKGDKRIRVGFVSPDFRRHSVSFSFMPFLKALDRTRIRVHCYGEIKRSDDVTRQIEGLVDHFYYTNGLSDRSVADSILSDGIDILVDLAGHTGGNRLPVFALKPAPIQITWLGYPATTGLSQVDYRITDAVADPPGLTERFHSERLIRLPEGFLCYDPLDPAPAVGQLPCLNSDRITFGSFNNLPKINPGVIHLWSRMLQSVRGSQLVLKSRQLVDRSVCMQVMEQFNQQGIESERIQMFGRTASTAEHLALYNRIDIAVDTFPYNGTTTTCEALWMGVPVISLCGDRHAARVGASILTCIGLPELIARNPEAFVNIGIDLAADTRRLLHMRTTLRKRLQNSLLCNAGRFAENMLTVFQSLVQSLSASDGKQKNRPEIRYRIGEIRP